MRTRSKSFVVLTLGLAAVALFLGYSQYQASHPLQGDQGVAGERTSAPAPKTDKISEKNLNQASEKADNPAEDYSNVDAAITSDWMRRVGKLTHEERASYAAYDEKTLIELAKNGETQAMHLLAHLYVGRGIYEDNNLEKAQKYAEQGAVHGLVSTIPTLATLALAPPDFLKNDNSELFAHEAKSHSKLIEAVALSQTIALRGDPDLAEIMKKDNVRSYNTAYNASVRLTAADEAAIKQRALEIYSGWQKQRQEIGLGEFESPPDSVKKYMGILAQGE
jgi:hypothetical protein